MNMLSTSLGIPAVSSFLPKQSSYVNRLGFAATPMELASAIGMRKRDVYWRARVHLVRSASGVRRLAAEVAGTQLEADCIDPSRLIGDNTWDEGVYGERVVAKAVDVDGRALGAAVWHRAVTEPGDLMDAADALAALSVGLTERPIAAYSLFWAMVYVVPEMRGHGIGSMLAGAAARMMRSDMMAVAAGLDRIGVPLAMNSMVESEPLSEGGASLTGHIFDAMRAQVAAARGGSLRHVVLDDPALLLGE